MKKDKVVMYECTWKACGRVVPESHASIQKQKQRNKALKNPLAIRCPYCGSSMRRKIFKEK